jgi:hypothetical protein
VIRGPALDAVIAFARRTLLVRHQISFCTAQVVGAAVTGGALIAATKSLHCTRYPVRLLAPVLVHKSQSGVRMNRSAAISLGRVAAAVVTTYSQQQTL